MGKCDGRGVSSAQIDGVGDPHSLRNTAGSGITTKPCALMNRFKCISKVESENYTNSLESCTTFSFCFVHTPRLARIVLIIS